MKLIPLVFVSLVLIVGCMSKEPVPMPKDPVPSEPFNVQGVGDIELKGGHNYFILYLDNKTSISATDTVSLNVPNLPKGVALYYSFAPHLTTAWGSTTLTFVSSDSSLAGTYNLTLYAVSKSGHKRSYDFNLTVLPFNGYKLGHIVQNIGGRAPANTYYLTWHSSGTGKIQFMFKQSGAPAPGVYRIVNYTALSSNDEVAITEENNESGSGVWLWLSTGKDSQTIKISVNDGKYTVEVPPTEMMAGPGVTTTLTAMLREL